MKKFGVAKALSLTIILSFMIGTNPMAGHAAGNEDHPFDDMPKTGNVFTNMDTQIDQFKVDHDIQNESTVHALKLHLTAVKHFQQQGKMDKVMKHMKGFKRLLDYQKNNKAISEKAFDVLNTYAEYMIGKQKIPFDSDKVMEHIRHLSVDIGPREAGSENEKKGAQYIKDVMSSYGYDTTIEKPPRSDRVKPQLKILSENNKEIPLKAAYGSPNTSEDGITGYVYDAGTGQPDDFTKDVDGNIALIQNGGISAADKVKNAVDAGATGVIIYDNKDSYTLPFIFLGGNKSAIPVVGITKKDGGSLLSQISAGELHVNLSIQTLTNQTTRNVIAVKKPKGVKNPEIVYIGSHLDSVPFAPGANDDGSGSSTLMELARVFKDYDGDKELRFAAFGGEELGFVGSRYHVNHLSQDEIDRTLVQFQMDMVGTAWVPASQLFINTVDGKTNLVSESTHQAADKLGIDNSLLPVHMLSRSDHVPFHEKGVDSALFIWMEPGTPPGAANIEPYYHSLEDKIKHVSPERIQLSGDVVFTAISDLIGFQTNSVGKETKRLKDAS